MPTSASNSGRGQKISLPTCLPSNRRSWRHEEAHHRLKHNSRVKELAFAIRTILESGVLHSEPQQPVFEEHPPVWKSSSFLQDGALVATRTLQRQDRPSSFR